jgi:hypothetical protein
MEKFANTALGEQVATARDSIATTLNDLKRGREASLEKQTVLALAAAASIQLVLDAVGGKVKLTRTLPMTKEERERYVRQFPQAPETPTAQNDQSHIVE